MRWFILCFFLSFAFAQPAQDPQTPPPVGKYSVGRILSVGTATATVQVGSQRIDAQLPTDVKDIKAGQQVVIYQVDGQNYITEPYRLNYLWGLIGLFVLCVGLLGRGKGLRGILGTLASIAVLAFFVVPEIAKGNNPLLITFIGAFGILALSIYFVHGANRKTTAALIGTSLATLVALVLSSTFTTLAQFTGLTSEETFLARYSIANLDLVSLYLSGVVVGALGALNDVTVTQSSVIQALVQANPRYTIRELYNRGMTVGFDHIGSLVNTLVLAYASGALPLLLLINQSNEMPILMLINTEPFAAELVSMVIGSLALVLAVPLTTLVAAWLLRGKKLEYLERRWPEESPRPTERLMGWMDQFRKR